MKKVEAYKVSIGSLLVGLVALVIAFKSNLEKLEVSHSTFLIHALVQGCIIYGIIYFSKYSIVIRLILSLFLSIILFYLLAYNSHITYSAVMIALTSPVGEAIDFLKFNGVYLVLSIAALIGIVVIEVSVPRYFGVMLVALILGYLVVPSLYAYRETSEKENYHYLIASARAKGYSPTFSPVSAYLREDASWRFPILRSALTILETWKRSSAATPIASSWTDVEGRDAPDLLVIGIGESVRAANLGIYGYHRDTTPRLLEAEERLTVYQNVYAAGANTRNALSAAMSKVDGAADLSKSITTLAEAAGYQTHWISNHSRYGTWTFMVTAIAEQAKHKDFVSVSESGSTYDSALIAKLEKTLESRDENSKDLIYVHFYGSHSEFSDRYPPEFSVFGEDSHLNQYDNSILYHDYVQAEIMRVISEHGGEYLYFADHGLGAPDGPIPLRHDMRRTPSLDSLAVPFFTMSKRQLKLEQGRPVSLFYLECIFSEWSGISAAELVEDDYCVNALSEQSVKFLDADLGVRTMPFEPGVEQAASARAGTLGLAGRDPASLN